MSDDQANVPTQTQSTDPFSLAERVAALEEKVTLIMGAIEALRAQLQELQDAI